MAHCFFVGSLQQNRRLWKKRNSSIMTVGSFRDGDLKLRNTYFIGYFPFIAIVLFSFSFAIYFEVLVLDLFVRLGLYQGMLEFFSETGIKIALLVVLVLIFFMLFSALKLISDTLIEVSLLLFSKDSEGLGLKSIRMGAVLYVIGAALSLLSIQSILGLLAIFTLTNLIAFIYFVYKTMPLISMSGLIGLIFFHIFIWSTFLLIVGYCILKLYNSIVDSLPI